MVSLKNDDSYGITYYWISFIHLIDYSTFDYIADTCCIMERLKRQFECGICLQTCVDAVETCCCSNLFCQRCVLALHECPFCGTDEFKTEPSKVARRVISSLPVECQHCEVEVERGLMERHLLDCEELEHICSVEKCEFVALRDAFLEHFWSEHKHLLIKYHSSSVQATNFTAFFDQSADSTVVQKLHMDFVMANGITNSAGRNAFLNSTNLKFYCRGPLNKCGCKDPLPYVGCGANRCGPEGGCNCRECMELDMKWRRLEKGQLYNSCGKVAILHEDGHYSCAECTRHKNGNLFRQCLGCQNLDLQTKEAGLYDRL